jgi:hypothetical protein
MGNASTGTVKESGMFDVRFLNPFEKLPNGNFFGTRYGYIQFIYLGCVLISLISVFIYSSDKSKLPLQLLFLIISYFVMYYSLSCLLIPNDHERCYFVAWTFLLSVIISTVLSIFGESLFKNINKFIKHLSSKKEMNGSGYNHSHKNNYELLNGGDGHAHKKDEDMYGAGGHLHKEEKENMYGAGGYGYKKDEDMYGAGGHLHKEEKENMYGAGGYGYKKDEDMYGAGGHAHKKNKKHKKHLGGAHCKDKEDEQTGGRNCKDKRTEEQTGGRHCYKNEQEGGYFKY